jgi:cobalt-zinc-cadmium efflux system outer membrane protein
MYRTSILNIFKLFGIAGAAVLAGCATVQKDAGFADVQKLAAERGNFVIVWNRDTADDRAAAARVYALLTAPLTADGAVQVALLNNHYLQATFEDLGIAQADLVQAGLLKNPVFDIGVRFPNRGPSGTYLDIAAAENFLDIALIPARKKLAGGQFEQAKARVSDEVFTLAAQARSAFYACQAAAQMLEFRKMIAEAASASADVAKRMHDAGNVSELDFAGQRAQGTRARVELEDARAEADEARERVNDLMGVWGSETEWTLAGPLAEVPAGEVSVDGLESLALHQRQDLSAARREVLVQARTLGMTADYRYFQEANLGPEFEHETDGQWRIGPTLSVPIPLFDQGQARIARQSALLRQSQERYYALKADIRSQVRAATARLLNARTKAQLYHDEVLPIDEELLHQTQLQYNGMLVGVFQLLQAKSGQIEGTRQYIEALRDYWTARAELERAAGGRLSGSAGAGSATAATVPATTPATMPATSDAMPGMSHPLAHHHPE